MKRTTSPALPALAGLALLLALAAIPAPAGATALANCVGQLVVQANPGGNDWTECAGEECKGNVVVLVSGTGDNNASCGSCSGNIIVELSATGSNGGNCGGAAGKVARSLAMVAD